jgi:hypothetical protein
MKATLRATRHALLLLAAASLLPSAQAAVLGYSSSAQVYGYVYTDAQSTLIPGLSTTQLQFYLPGDYQYSPTTATPLVQKSINIDPGQTVGADVVYDLVTDQGQYGFGFSGSAQVLGAKLKTLVETTRVDVTGAATDTVGSSTLYAYANAYWNDQWLIQADARHAAGSYGAVVVGLKLDGNFGSTASPSTRNDGSASLTAYATFTDKAGVSYQSNFSIGTSSYDTNWNGANTVYKKLLFQYGTPFNLNLSQYAYGSGNSSVDFFNTGAIESIELPFGALLESGYLEAGGSLGDFGTVFNSATVDAENTNWDFGNNGGGFTPNVPEPESLVLALAGLGLLGGWRLKAHKTASVRVA